MKEDKGRKMRKRKEEEGLKMKEGRKMKEDKGRKMGKREEEEGLRMKEGR